MVGTVTRTMEPRCFQAYQPVSSLLFCALLPVRAASADPRRPRVSAYKVSGFPPAAHRLCRLTAVEFDGFGFRGIPKRARAI